MPDAMTPLDLGAIRARSDARRDYADERPESLHDPEHYAALADESAADVPALVAEVERLRAEFDRLDDAWDEDSARCCTGDASQHDGHHKSCRYVHGDLRPDPDDRPAPAWDEKAVRGAFIDARLASALEVMEDGYPSVCIRSNEEATDVALAVVRDHLPVKPSREDIYRAWHGTDDPWGGCADSASIERVLDLLPGRSEAKVKAEALREWIAEWPTTPDDGTFLADVARDGLARADVARLEEGLSDRTMDLAEVARLRTMVGDCHCDKNPETTNGPEEDCPQHGRPVAEVWGLVERAEAGWDHARAEVDRLRAEVRLAKASARPAPAWDEEAVAEAVRKDLEAVGILPWTNGGARIVRTVLAVVREHLPVKLSREDVADVLDECGTWCGMADVSHEYGPCPACVERCMGDAHAVLDLWPGRSEAEVKAEALREAADWLADMDDGRDAGQHRAGRDIIARLRARADRLAAEGGADRG